MGLLALTVQDSLSVRPWETQQSSGVSVNHTVALSLGAASGSGTSSGGLSMDRSSVGGAAAGDCLGRTRVDGDKGDGDLWLDCLDASDSFLVKR